MWVGVGVRGRGRGLGFGLGFGLGNPRWHDVPWHDVVDSIFLLLAKLSSENVQTHVVSGQLKKRKLSHFWAKKEDFCSISLSMLNYKLCQNKSAIVSSRRQTLNMKRKTKINHKEIKQEKSL